MSLYSSDCKCPLETDEQIKNNPHSEWCDQCQKSVCKNCFEEHKSHEYSGSKVARIINSVLRDPDIAIEGKKELQEGKEFKNVINDIVNQDVKKKLEKFVENTSKGVSHPL